MEHEKDVEWPKAGFADGRTWEDVMQLDPEDDIWECVDPIDKA
jgi:hypothetical protein